MSSNELVEQIMAQVIARVATPEQQAIPGQPQPIRETAMAEKSCSLTEFVGTALGDTKCGIEVALKELDRTFGDVYGNEAGHIELQYTARASYALEKAFGAPIGRACGIQAVTSAREIGKTVLATLGSEPKNDRPSYI